MIALKALGIFCLFFIFMIAPIDLVILALKKEKPTKLNKIGKRESKIDRISWLEYFIIILPLCLLLIGLLTNNSKEKLTSFTILGVGYTGLLLSPYNNRLGIPWVNRTVFISCSTIALVSYWLSFTDYDFILNSNHHYLAIMLLPLATYIYLFIARQILKFTIKVYPLTLDRYFRVGHFSSRESRKATYWDLIWTLLNLICIPILLVYLFEKTK